MRTKRRIFCIILALVCVLLDSSVLPFTGLDMRYVPRLCIAAICLIATVLGATQGIIYGAMCGILLDITVYQPTGLCAVTYTLCGLLVGFLTHRVRASLVTVIPPAAGMLLYEITMLFYTYFNTNYFPAGRIGYAFVRMIIALVIVQLMYLPGLKILKPARIGRLKR